MAAFFAGMDVPTTSVRIRLRMRMGEGTSSQRLRRTPSPMGEGWGDTAVMLPPTRIRGNDAAESQNGYNFRRLI